MDRNYFLAQLNTNQSFIPKLFILYCIIACQLGFETALEYTVAWD